MRLIVLAPTKEQGLWAAKQMKASVLGDMGFIMSDRQTRVFTASDPDAMRGFELRRGDHVLTVAGWDEDGSLEEHWRYVDRIGGSGVWYSKHEGMGGHA